MKPFRLFLVFIFVSVFTTLFAQQNKRVFIVLDVSNSMHGNKYNMANYTSQLLSLFRGDHDQVGIYYLGKKVDLSSHDAYKRLHTRFEQLPAAKSSYHEIGDLLRFMDDYVPSGTQDWLFIIGDGDWNWRGAKEDYQRVTARFASFVRDNNLHVCYLQTGDDLAIENEFTGYLRLLAMPEIEILKSDTSVSSVRDNAVYFANKIMGFSSETVSMTKKDAKTYTFTTLFPLLGFQLLYQWGSLSGDGATPVTIASATTGQGNIPFHLKGNPSTRPLVGGAGEQSVIEGAVWQFDVAMGCSSTASVQFGQAVDAKSLKLYPLVDVLMQVEPLNPLTNNSMARRHDGTFVYAKSHSTRTITGTETNTQNSKLKTQNFKITFTDTRGRKLQWNEQNLKLIEVVLNDGTKDYAAVFNQADSTFRIELTAVKDTLSYRVRAEAKGYFMLESETQTLVSLPIYELAPYTIHPTPYTFLSDSVSMLSDAGFQMNAFGYNGFQLLPHEYDLTESCECAFPDTMFVELMLMPDTGVVVDGRLYGGIVVKVALPVDHRPWLSRCKKKLFAIVALFFASLYLIFLRRKRRFAKSATLTPSYYNSYQQLKRQSPYKLRRNGIGPWFCRWFLHGSESVHIHCSHPQANIKLVAGDNTRCCYLPSSCYDSAKMTVPGIDKRQSLSPNGKPIKLTAGSIIEIRKRDKSKDGTLRFDPGSVDGVGGYRFVLLLLILASWFTAGYIIVSII